MKFHTVLISLLIFNSWSLLAQWQNTADSLRLLQQYALEYKVRSENNPKEEFYTQLAYANYLISEQDFQKAQETLLKLKPKQESQEFWKLKTEAHLAYESETENEAYQRLKQFKTQKGSILEAIQYVSLAIYYSGTDVYAIIQYLEKAHQLLQKLGYQNHYLNGLVMNDLAYYYDFGQINSKVFEFQTQALKLFLRYYPQDFSMITTTHNNAVAYFQAYGDVKKAALIQKSFDQYMHTFFTSKNKYLQHNKFTFIHGTALYYLSALRYAALSFNEQNLVLYGKKMEQLFSNAPKEWKEKNFGILYSAYDMIYYAFSKNRKFDLARAYALKINSFKNNAFFEMKKNANMALTHYYEGNNLLAYQFADQSIKSMEAVPTASLQVILTLQAEVLSRMGNRAQAELKLQEAFQKILNQDSVNFRQLKAEDFNDKVTQRTLQILIKAGNIYRNFYEQLGKKNTDLKQAEHFYLLGTELFETYYQKGTYNAALGEVIDEIEEGLYALPRTENQIIADLNRLVNLGSVHRWNKFTTNYIQNLSLPAQTLRTKNELQLKKNLLSRSYQEEVKNKEEIQKINTQLEKIEETLRNQNPEYKHLCSADFKVENLQKKLHNTETLIAYSIGISHVFAHVITQNKVGLYNLGLKEKIEPLVQKYYASVKERTLEYTSIQDSLKPLLIHRILPKNTEKLIIIPDGFLNEIPFEALLDSPLPLSYAIHLKNLLLKESENRKFGKNMAGFAPSYGNNLQPLQFAIKEIDSIKDLIGKSDLFENGNASKNRFLETLGTYKIHHLAMHSHLDSEDYEYSSLLFAQQVPLYFHEIYALNFPSELVVLSACNTGVGSFINGEGAMSLGMALHYAGVKASLYSLWPVPDKESAEIMQLFYQFLAQGYSKDQALHRAKTSFKEQNPLKNHPYYWAGFIISGDTAPIFSKSKFPLYGIAGIFLLWIIWYKRKSLI